MNRRFIDQVSVFDGVADALRAMVPVELGDLRCPARRYGIKVWFGGDKPPREHYEAQVIGPNYVPDASVLALEVGFHAEHPRQADNEAALDRLLGAERKWRRRLGPEAASGPFLGPADGWRRISETWADPDLSSPDLPFEVAARLTDYITALEPLRQRPPRQSPRRQAESPPGRRRTTAP
jgi:hypothetical protein